MACTTSPPKALPHTLYLASSLVPLKGALERASAGKFPLNLVFQSSSLIAKHIISGAPCDAVIVADERWRDFLLKKAVVEHDGSVVARNRLIVASTNKTAANDTAAFFKTIGAEKIIIGDPAVCPLGVFSKEALQALGVFEQLKPNFIMAHDAQNARKLLSSGAATYAILYASDAASAAIKRVATIDQALHQAISYPILRCKGAAKERSDALYQLVFSPELKEAFRAHGFEPPS